MIKEFLVKEEDTVTVGQDLLKIELGSPPKDSGPKDSGDKGTAKEQSKQPAPSEQQTSPDPQPPSKEESRPTHEFTPPPPPPPPQEKKVVAKKETPTVSEKPDPKAETPFSGREERRVRMTPITMNNRLS
jgi:2-oxoglutarate dehydrogenase E2 component (dihydrolipoamide succinyltransferase)